MFLLIFCSLCVQKLWRVHTFLEMTNVCATTQLLTTSSATSFVYVTAGAFFAHGGHKHHGGYKHFAKKCVLLAEPRTIFLNLPTENIAYMMISLCAEYLCICAVSESHVHVHSLEGTLLRSTKTKLHAPTLQVGKRKPTHRRFKQEDENPHTNPTSRKTKIHTPTLQIGRRKSTHQPDKQENENARTNHTSRRTKMRTLALKVGKQKSTHRPYK